MTAARRRNIVRQLIDEVLGSRIEIAHSLTYVWLATHFGYFAVGLIGSLFLGWLVSGDGDGGFWFETVVVLWLLAGLFKIYWFDYRKPAERQAKGPFPVDRGDLAGEAMVAAFFLTGGVLVTAVSGYDRLTALLVAAGFCLLSLVMSVFWLGNTRRLQRFGAPALLKLSSITEEPLPLGTAGVMAFVKGSGPLRHLVIQGPPASEKSELAVAIGVEALKAQPRLDARYLTLFRLYANAVHRTGEERDLCPWELADLLVIDDVDPSIPFVQVISPRTLVATLSILPEESLAILRSRRTVWVVGASASLQLWTEALTEVLDAEPPSVGTIALNGPKT